MKPLIFLDLETTGLDAWRDSIHMCGLLDEDNVYTAVRSPDDLNVVNEVEFVGHRTDFDTKFLEISWGVDFNDFTVHDTRILGSLVRQRVPKAFLERYEAMRREANKKLVKGQIHRKGSPLSLKVMAPWYLKVPPFWETPGNHDNEDYTRQTYFIQKACGML